MGFCFREGFIMKKILILLLALALCLSLCACHKDGQNSDDPIQFGDDNVVQQGGDGSAKEKPLIIHTENGTTLINEARFLECVEVVELTTENWQQYLKDYSYSYDEEKTETDAFGEVVSSEIITHTGRLLGAGNERIHGFVDGAIELKNKATGELKTYKFAYCGCPISEEQEVHMDGSNYQAIPDDFSFDNYKCTRIEGLLYYLNLPIEELPVGTLI